jgi:hypothetical protein
MALQQSFTHVENELLPKFRKRINEAESAKEVETSFGDSVQELFRKASVGMLEVASDDIHLKPETASFLLGEAIRSQDTFTALWDNSDLPRIVGRFAELAQHRHAHLAKKTEKTEAKIKR